MIPGRPQSQALAVEVDWSNRAPDAWDRQIIETAAQLAALALAADSRQDLARPAARRPARRRSSGRAR